MVCCDLSTPKAEGQGFSVYQDVNAKLVRLGVPAAEIAFIQDYDSDASKLKILAWRSHFVDAGLTAMVEQAAKELDTDKRMAMYASMQRAAQEMAPFAFMLQPIASAVMGKGVSGFVVGAVADFTKYAAVKKA